MPLDQPDDWLGLQHELARMPLGDHIEELRKRLLWAMVGFVPALVVAFIFGFRIIAWLAMPLIEAMEAAGMTPNVITTSSTMGFGTYCQVSLIAAAVFAAPWIIYQIWLFVVAGLYSRERRAVYLLAPFSTIMTVLAVLFTRYILLPVTMVFFAKFALLYPSIQPGHRSAVMEMMYGRPPTADIAVDPAAALAKLPRIPVLAVDPVKPPDGSFWINASEGGRIKYAVGGLVRPLQATQDQLLSPMPSLEEFVSFAAMTGLGIVAAFQLPVVMLVIGWSGLFDPETLRPFRKYAFFGIAILAAVLTPGDIASMMVLFVPLYALYELGMLLMRLAYRREPIPDEL